jgi:hypothetical protein
MGKTHYKGTRFTNGAPKGIMFLKGQPGGAGNDQWPKPNDQGNSKLQGGARNGDEEGGC